MKSLDTYIDQIPEYDLCSSTEALLKRYVEAKTQLEGEILAWPEKDEYVQEHFEALSELALLGEELIARLKKTMCLGTVISMDYQKILRVLETEHNIHKIALVNSDPDMILHLIFQSISVRVREASVVVQ